MKWILCFMLRIWKKLMVTEKCCSLFRRNCAGLTPGFLTHSSYGRWLSGQKLGLHIQFVQVRAVDNNRPENVAIKGRRRTVRGGKEPCVLQ